jgi:hypothetical protein
LQQSCASSSSRHGAKLVFAALFARVCLSSPHASGPTPYQLLSEKASVTQTTNQGLGLAYVISGATTLGISIPGYYLSEDVFARSVYAIGESIGVVAMGYGVYLLLIENEYSRFKKIVDSSASLTSDHKNQLAKSFLNEQARRAKNVRKIRAVSHAMMAGLNTLNAVIASHRDLRTALFFLGGVNTLVFLHCLFSTSEEESIPDSTTSIGLSPNVQIALRVRF